MKVWTLILVLGLPAAAVLGWVQVALPSGIGIKPVIQAVRIPQIDHAGVHAAVAFGQIEKIAPAQIDLSLAPLEPTDVEVEEPIELIFRRSISAVIGEGGGINLVIVDPKQPNERKSFKVGQEFRDGWKIAGITPQLITLKKRDVLKEIPLFAGSKPVSPETAEEDTAPAQPPGHRRRP
jgi:hypothetical protein